MAQIFESVIALHSCSSVMVEVSFLGDDIETELDIEVEVLEVEAVADVENLVDEDFKQNASLVLEMTCL